MMHHSYVSTSERQVSRTQQNIVDAFLIKPFSRSMLWDVLRPFGDTIDTILVIDDDRDFVRLLGRMLDNPVRRYQVVSASSGWLRPEWFISHNWNLDEAPEVFAMIARGEVVKGFVVLHEAPAAQPPAVAPAQQGEQVQA